MNLSRPARVLLETERLVLRRYEMHDLDRLARLNADPEVMRYIGTGGTRTRQETHAGILRAQRIYENFPGLGFFIAEEKPARRFIGVFALIYIPGTAEVEVGYRLARAAWGRGFATEGARALVRYGLFELGLHRVVGLTHRENDASKRVLMKAGLAPRGLGWYYEKSLNYFVATRPDAPASAAAMPGRRRTTGTRRR